MAKVTVSVNYSYREYGEGSIDIEVDDVEDIDGDLVLDELVRQEGLSEDAETQIEDWAVDE